MQRGQTVKVSISVRKDDLAVLRRRAKKLYKGNLSAIMAEAAAAARRKEAQEELLEWIGPIDMTSEEKEAIRAEWRR
jgi:hypothetical protein